MRSIGHGDTLVKLAFTFASRYAPGAELYYNDFNAWRPANRDGIVRLVRMLRKEGVRIDGVGMQGHWGLTYPRTEYIEAAIDSFAALGVKVMITEMDVDLLPIRFRGERTIRFCFRAITSRSPHSTRSWPCLGRHNGGFFAG